MKVSTLNINSVNARIVNLCKWLQLNQPDILLLQEIKCEFNNFPFFDLQTLGYNVEMFGQKGYNGVAILSKHNIKKRAENFPDSNDDNARYLECEICINNTNVIVASIYLPNGNPPYNAKDDKSKLIYKLKWMDAFAEHIENLLLVHKNIILGGDFNVILTDNDVYNPELFINDALYHPDVKKRLRNILRSGYADAFRSLYPKANGYTYWDYGNTAFRNDLGMRIDYLLTSPALSDKLVSCSIDKDFRSWEKSSDHTTLTAKFKDV